MRKYLVLAAMALSLAACNDKVEKEADTPTEGEEAVASTFNWEGANLYFLLTDRFNNGDPSNDINFDRNQETAVLRGFEGGDLKGVTQKIREGYFTDLGVNAIWMTPVVEQIHDGTDESTGYTYGYHGYWTKDWTVLDPNFGTEDDLKELVETAHENGIRILLDAVINHTGPVTDKDTVWPEEWVRTNPKCEFESYETTITCTLVENLPDIKTESNDAVVLPPQLVEKWKAEGRYEEEMKELDEFFARTGHPRAPRFYIMKWLADYILDYGIDGYRVDTVKHTEEYVWEEFKAVCDEAFSTWKTNNPEKIVDDSDFYMVGEIYYYSVQTGKNYDFGDKTVNYFNDSFDALINFDLRSSADRTYEQVFREYDSILNGPLQGYSTLSYMSSHDDGEPFDKAREKPYETANRLLLAPGAAQIYYGDEVARSLIIEGTNGDATLRSAMDWNRIESDSTAQAILRHWQKLGRFRNQHPAVGAGRHQMLGDAPYYFSRTYSEEEMEDKVVVGLDLPKGMKEMDVSSVFEDGTELFDSYSGQKAIVTNGKVSLESDSNVVLLEKSR